MPFVSNDFTARVIKRLPFNKAPSQFNCILSILFASLASFTYSQDGLIRPPSPCVKSEALKQFDFWIGTRRVNLADGTYAGKNTITREQKLNPRH